MLLPFLLSPLVLAANRAPVITLSDGDAVLCNHGESVALPMRVSDADGDPITLFYRFDDASSWLAAPAGDAANVLPGRLFAGLDRAGAHTLHLDASDGAAESAPVSLGLGALLRGAGPRVRGEGRVRVGKRSGNRAAPDGLPPPPGAPAAAAPAVGIAAEIRSLGGGSVAVSYSFDDSGVWSAPVSYPRGDVAVAVPQSAFRRYAAPGAHKVTLRFLEAGGALAHDEWHYHVNSPPALRVTDAAPLAFSEMPTGSVALPIAVLDSDGDEVALWYRFDGKGDWIYVPAGFGANVVPAAARAANGGSGFVEVAAWDGYDHSEETVRIGYAFGAVGDGERGEDGAGGALSTGAIAGIAGGAVAVIALGVAVVAIGVRRRRESSSSTGLVETE
jgi:hypothetical protein